MHPISNIDDAVKWICGDGSWSLLPHEQQIVDAALEFIEPDQAELIRCQLNERFFMERMGGGGRINAIFFDSKPVRFQVSDPAFKEKSIRVFVKVDGKRQRTMVKFYDGYIRTIQLPKVRKVYRKMKSFEVVKVEAGKDEEGYEKAIDRMAHGRDPGDGAWP